MKPVWFTAFRYMNKLMTNNSKDPLTDYFKMELLADYIVLMFRKNSCYSQQRFMGLWNILQKVINATQNFLTVDFFHEVNHICFYSNPQKPQILKESLGYICHLHSLDEVKHKHVKRLLQKIACNDCFNKDEKIMCYISYLLCKK